MPSENPNRQLLLCILALQMDFISREQLIAAASTWLHDKSQPIEEILIAQRALSEVDRQLLVPLVERHIENHNGDPSESLAVLSSVDSLVEDLNNFGDSEFDATVSIIGSKQSPQPHSRAVVQQFRSGLSNDAGSSSDARYRIIRSHAKGGLGEVSLAHDAELNRNVALKEIQSQYAADEVSRARFLLEAEVTGSLEHPGIVPVYGLGSYADGRPFYAMRFIKGDSLKEAVDRFHADNRSSRIQQRSVFDSVAFRKLLGRFIDVCEAIEYAHSRGVLHRDLKPGNIMIGKYGETLVVDWGLAKALGQREGEEVTAAEATFRPSSGQTSSATHMGSAIGTPSYMSPEQAEGNHDQLGPKSDVYSLGATLYYLLTGKRPCSGKDLTEILRQVIEGQFPRPRDLESDIPRALEAICLKAMARSPKDRYESPRGLADEIQRWLADKPVEAYREPLVPRAGRWIRHHKTTTVAIATAVLVLVTTVTFFVTRQVQHSIALQEQVASLVEEGRKQNHEGNTDGAIRLLAIAAGLDSSSDQKDREPTSVERQLHELSRFRDFQRGADKLLDGGIHGMDAQEKPDPIVEECTRVLALYDIEDDSNWHTALAGGVLEPDQIENTRNAAAKLLVLKAVRIALFDTKGESGREAARVAILLLNRAEQLKPLTFGIWMCRMLFHRRVGEDELADKAGSRMVELGKSNTPRTALDYYLLGSVSLHILKQPDAAVGLYEQSLSVEPDYFGAAVGLYFAQETKANTQGQLSALNRCLAIHPNEPELYFYRGMTLFQLRKYKLAIRDFDRHADRNPSVGLVHYWRGRCNIMLERWEDADDAFTRSFEVDKQLLNRLSWRALARAKLNERFADAAKDADDVLGSEDVGTDDAWRCARVFALCSASASQAGSSDSAESYASRSIDLLRQGLRQGGIKPVQLVSEDLATLRERDDFRKLQLEFPR